MPFGVPELIIILVIVLIVLGPKRLPSLGRQLGGGMREFKDSISGSDKGDHDADDAPEPDSAPAAGRPELTRSQQADVLDPQADVTRPPAGARDEAATRPGREPS